MSKEIPNKLSKEYVNPNMVILNEPVTITKTTSYDITKYEIDNTVTVVLDKSLTMYVSLYNDNKIVEGRSVTLTDTDFEQWIKDGTGYLKSYVENNIIKAEK
jgi:hypothetical protein